MARRAVGSGLRQAVSAAGLGIVLLAAPTVVLAADDAVTVPAITSVTTDPGPGIAGAVDVGPVILLLVAGTLGLLGVLSGPANSIPERHPIERRRATSH